MSLGFDWGFQSSSNASSIAVSGGPALVATPASENGRHVFKRRKEDEDQELAATTTMVSNSRIRQKKIGKPAYFMAKKKSQLSSTIRGQPLPLSRSLELLDRSQVQQLLLDVMDTHPALQLFLQRKLENVTVPTERCMDLLQSKYDQMINNIPYHKNYCENLDDYAFVRLKPLLMEFLNCLIDCVLDKLTPRCDNCLDSWKFLDFCTALLLKVPRFNLENNNYYVNKCMEQLSHVWCTLIEYIAKDNITHWVLNNKHLFDDWLKKLQFYNEQANGLLNKPLEMCNMLELPETLTGSISTVARNSATPQPSDLFDF